MKRVNLICTVLFFMGLHYKLTGTGPALSWIEVFLPFIIEAVLYILLALDALFNLTGPVRMWIIKPIIMWKFERDVERAKKALNLRFEAKKEGNK